MENPTQNSAFMVTLFLTLNVYAMCNLPSFANAVLAWTHSQTELRPSTKHPGYYDLPKEASTWLKNFRSANSQFLSQVPSGYDVPKIILGYIPKVPHPVPKFFYCV